MVAAVASHRRLETNPKNFHADGDVSVTSQTGPALICKTSRPIRLNKTCCAIGGEVFAQLYCDKSAKLDDVMSAGEASQESVHLALLCPLCLSKTLQTLINFYEPVPIPSTFHHSLNQG